MKNFSKLLTLLLTVMLLFVSCSDDKDLECVHSYDLQANGTLICSSCNESFTSPYIGKVNNGKVEILKTFTTTGELKTDEKAEFVIYSNGGDVKINAPKATVTHFGKADNVDIVAVAPDTYIGKAEIKKAVSVLTGHIKFAVDVPSVIIPAEAKDVCISQHEEKGKIAKLEVKSNVVLELPVKEVTVEAKDVVVTLNEGAMVETLEAKAEATGVKVENFSGTDIKTAKNTTPTNYVAKIGTKGFESLSSAITSATDGSTIKLTADVKTSSQIEIADKSIVLDMNGKTIIYNGPELASGVLLVHNGAKLTVTGNGTIDSGNEASAAIALTKSGDDTSKVAELVVENGTFKGKYYPITGNGSRHNTKITINGGTFLSTAGNDGLAIFHPQDGELIVNGGDFTGYGSAIEMRAGKLVINGGTFKATADSFSCQSNGSGSTTVGAAIAIAQHTTKKDIAVTINGGTFTGVKALSNENPENNNPASKVEIKVFGGTFSSEPTTYVASGYQATKSGSTWVVTATTK